MSNDPTNGITLVGIGEMCPICDIENLFIVDYREVVKILKGEADANLPLIHCKECGNRLAPCSMCTDAINDGIIAEEERVCDDCPITKYWNAKFGEDKHGEDDMSEEQKTPTLDEIMTSFDDKCHCNYDNDYDLDDCTPCDYCRLLHPDYDTCESYKKGKWTPGCNGCVDMQGNCAQHYIYDVATGKRDINTPLWNPPKVPEWFEVGAKLWRKSYNDWVVIKSLAPTAGVDEDGNTLFFMTMVAWDGSEDIASLPHVAFSTEAPFSESFRKLLGKHAWHKGLSLMVRILGYAYKTNTVYFSYPLPNGDSTSVGEEFNEENFASVIKGLSWFKVGQWIGATKDCRTIGEIVGMNGDIIEVDWIANGEPVGEQFDVTCSTQVLAFVPVKFRPYAYEEAVKLLGKVMMYKPTILPRNEAAIVSRVAQYIGEEEVYIISLPFREWKEMNATIDGLPIGVPVVDEELLSNP